MEPQRLQPRPGPFGQFRHRARVRTGLQLPAHLHRPAAADRGLQQRRAAQGPRRHQSGRLRLQPEDGLEFLSRTNLVLDLGQLLYDQPNRVDVFVGSSTGTTSSATSSASTSRAQKRRAFWRACRSTCSETPYYSPRRGGHPAEPTMRRHRYAKIVATVGPATDTPEMLKALFLAGVDTFRLNFSTASRPTTPGSTPPSARWRPRSGDPSASCRICRARRFASARCATDGST